MQASDFFKTIEGTPGSTCHRRLRLRSRRDREHDSPTLEDEYRITKQHIVAAARQMVR